RALDLLDPVDVVEAHVLDDDGKCGDHPSETNSGALGKSERPLVRRRRGERLLERPADRRLAHVERLDLADLDLSSGLGLAYAELGEIAGATYARCGRREERLRPEEVAERGLGLGVDTARRARVRAGR